MLTICKVPLYTKGKVTSYALVSLGDYEEISKHKWHESNLGYAIRRTGVGPRGACKVSVVWMHREIICSDGMSTDHINMDKLDNRRENLRLATHGQNMVNKRGIKGVYVRKYKGDVIKYMAVITKGEERRTRFFEQEEEAICWRDINAIAMHGEFASPRNPISTYFPW